MILDELVLHDFGIFAGRQALTLTPSPGRPIILFGGQNGAGKTTLLDGLQLALYGKLARISNRSGLRYEDYLLRSIHAKNGARSASVGLTFRHVREGEEHRYELRRFWEVARRGSVRERFVVVVDGREDRTLREGWAEFISEILPVQLAPLFFFDGEKIERFADPKRSADMLRSATHALLGLDVVDLLTTDLLALEKRKQIALADESSREELTELERKLKSIEDERSQVLFERGARMNALDKRKLELEEVEARFRREGGELYEKVAELRDERARLQQREEHLASRLRELAQGPAPLLMVQDLLAATRAQAAAEFRAKEQALLADVLAGRDSDLLDVLRGEGAPERLLGVVARHLAEDRAQRAGPTVEPFLQLDEEDREVLQLLAPGMLADLQRTATEMVEAHDEVSLELSDRDRLLAGVPAPESLEPLLRERKAAEARVEAAEREVEALERKLDELERHRTHYRTRYSAALERAARAAFVRQDVHRLLRHSGRVRETVARFRDRFLERNLGRLSAEIFESFAHLLRKERLVTGLRIDPGTFSLTLLGSDEGDTLSAAQLSAGERQLLAVAMLWGLGRVSGRLLPVVIDTPMGRLDSAHRTNLVQRYFPFAGEQVVLLSTDEEVDERYRAELKPHISHEYHLEHDDAAGATFVHPGYF